MSGATRKFESAGKVYLVGAGPGDPELLTLKGKRCIEEADVIFYDELVNAELLAYARADCELRYVGKRAGACCIEQRAIETQMIRFARQAKKVVRLKGGDPFVFGRGGEETQALRDAGVAFEIVPGISTAIAVPAYAGIPVTHRACASSVALVTGHDAANEKIKWAELARSVDTLVILMGLRNLRKITSALLAGGCDPARPAALIQSGTLAAQKIALAASPRSPAWPERKNSVHRRSSSSAKWQLLPGNYPGFMNYGRMDQVRSQILPRDSFGNL